MVDHGVERHFASVDFYGSPYERAQTNENMGKTRLQNLLRHKSGRYYARAFADGKEVWPVKTLHFGVVEARLGHYRTCDQA